MYTYLPRQRMYKVWLRMSWPLFAPCTDESCWKTLWREDLVVCNIKENFSSSQWEEIQLSIEMTAAAPLNSMGTLMSTSIQRRRQWRPFNSSVIFKWATRNLRLTQRQLKLLFQKFVKQAIISKSRYAFIVLAWSPFSKSLGTSISIYY